MLHVLCKYYLYFIFPPATVYYHTDATRKNVSRAMHETMPSIWNCFTPGFSWNTCNGTWLNIHNKEAICRINRRQFTSDITWVVYMMYNNWLHDDLMQERITLSSIVSWYYIVLCWDERHAESESTWISSVTGTTEVEMFQ